MKIENSTVLITGASRGIGKALAQQMAQQKTHLILAMRSIPHGLEAELVKAGALSVRLVVSDLQTRQGVQELCDFIEREKIHVDILVNNAGQLTGGLLEEQKLEDIYNMMQVNLMATVHLTHFFIPRMLARGGKIVNNASVSGKMFFPCANTYAASKAAVVALSESLMGELADTPVSVLLMITPGVKTEMYDEIANQYGKNMDLSFMNSISAKLWAEKVVAAIENDDTHVWPLGSTRFGVWFGYHFPKTFRHLLKSKFSRIKK